AAPRLIPDCYLDNYGVVNFPPFPDGCRFAIPIYPTNGSLAHLETDKKSPTVLYKKIRLRCTKLYFCWQTIIPIDPEPLNLLLESSNKPMKNLSIPIMSGGSKDFGISIADSR
ncbi:MAG TPA: hypothetical protein VGA01_09780, partial [Candidatus Binatia bacterium]